MPKKIALLTDWVTVGTAGPTVDGRNIADTVLAEMAASYDPEVYTAVINSEHLLGYYGSFGHVRELRSGKDKNSKAILEARLEPNVRMLDMATYGQRLFTSMEIMEDFAETGKAYLVGLAITDQPASLGTTELRFTKSANNGQMRAAPAEIAGDVFCLQPPPATAEPPAAPTKLRALADSFHALLTQAFVSAPPNAQPGKPDMTPEEIKALMGTELDTRFAALETKLTLLAKTPAAPAGQTTPPPPPADPVTTALAEFKAEAAKQTAGLAQLTATLTEALTKGQGNAGGKQPGDAGNASTAVL